MAITAITSISKTRILLNEGAADALTVTGTLTGSYYPGQFVMYIAASDTWTQLNSGTAAHKIADGVIGVIGFEKHINETTGAEVLITTQITYTDNWSLETPIVISGFVAGYVTDQSATVGVGTKFMASATAGSVTRLALENVDASGLYGTALKSVPVATLASQLKSGDTKGIFAIGKYFGLPYSTGPNRAGM